MLNTTGDVALAEIAKKRTTFFFFQYPKWNFFVFPQPQYILSMFLNFGQFSASCSYKNGFYTKFV